MKRFSVCLDKMHPLLLSAHSEISKIPTPSRTGMIGPPGRVQLTPAEKENFRALRLQRVRCCVRRQEEELLQFRVWFDPLNEGAANVVFKICPPQVQHNSPDFVFIDVCDDGNVAVPVPRQDMIGQVLRVSKGAPKCLKSEDIIRGFENDVRPLFKTRKYSLGGSRLSQDLGEKHLMDHRGVVLFPEVMLDLTHRVDSIQKVSGNETRDCARWGILLPDMSSIPGTSITLEIKPKWLLQSPTAPPAAVRCRTCALQYSRGKGTRKDYICPLRLVNSDKHDLYKWAVEAVVAHARKGKGLSADPQSVQFQSVVNHVVQYVSEGEGRKLLEHIRFLQGQLDPKGILWRDIASDRAKFDTDLRLAMTLRDCSMFISVPYSSTGKSLSPVVSKLGDLDFKSAGKISDWEKKERDLIEGRWYTKDPEKHVCWLATTKT